MVCRKGEKYEVLSHQSSDQEPKVELGVLSLPVFTP